MTNDQMNKSRSSTSPSKATDKLSKKSSTLNERMKGYKQQMADLKRLINEAESSKANESIVAREKDSIQNEIQKFGHDVTSSRVTLSARESERTPVPQEYVCGGGIIEAVPEEWTACVKMPVIQNDEQRTS